MDRAIVALFVGGRRNDGVAEAENVHAEGVEHALAADQGDEGPINAAVVRTVMQGVPIGGAVGDSAVVDEHPSPACGEYGRTRLHDLFRGGEAAAATGEADVHEISVDTVAFIFG